MSNTHKDNSKSMTVIALTLQVVCDAYAQGAFAPNQTEIVKEVTRIKNIGLTSCQYEDKSIQSGVSRALKALVEKEKVIKRADNRYIPFNLKTGRALLKEEIIKSVKFGPKHIFQMSATTWLIDVERSSIAKAKELFSRYLGPNCYDIIEFNGYLMMLFDGKVDSHKELREEILEIRKAALEKTKTTSRPKEPQKQKIKL